MIFFTSDTHFDHHNILFKYTSGTRTGANKEEMTANMITTWNQRVSPSDTVYHLGDVSFASDERTARILQQLNGTIHLVKGNHDKSALSQLCRDRFASIQQYLRVTIDRHTVVMFHYPIYEWDQMHRGAFHLYGHVHGGVEIAGRAMDVGIDTRTDMAPYSWDEVKQRLLAKPIREHH